VAGLIGSNSAETTCTTSPEQIEVMKLKRYSKAVCNKVGGVAQW